MNRFIKIKDPSFNSFKQWDFINKQQWYSRPYEYKYMIDTISTLGNDLIVLDAACGFKTPGYLMLADCKNVKEITAQDLGIGYASSFLTNKLEHEKVTKVKSDLTTWKPDKEYDVVVCISSMEHIPNYKAAIKTMYDALKPGGHLIITIDISKDKRHNEFVQNYMIYPDDYKAMFEYTGFSLIGEYDDTLNEDCVNGLNSLYGPSIHHNLYVFKFLLKK